MRKLLTILTLIVLTGCNATTPVPEVYTETSWQDLIPESCQQFFDGCNNCTREGDQTACTLKYCTEYGAPRCLDSN